MRDSKKANRAADKASAAALTKKYQPEVSQKTDQLGCLVYISHAEADDQGRSVRLLSKSAIIGRDETCDLILTDSSVSRQHVKLSASPEGIVVEDLGSTNGIFYQDKRIERATLSLGSRLGVGSCQIDLLPLTDSTSLAYSKRESYGDLRGASLPMRRLYSLLELLETSDAPVLIEGETGTGKELVARALHDQGLRAKGPFIVIDCGNVPSELMESELFGHCKGSFTGAIADRVGAFDAANGGTIFLDELDDLPLLLQPKLLRVIETGQFKRLGETKHRPVDVRIIAASKRDLNQAVALGQFREDLFYRVAVVNLPLPPLRQRLDDIPVLAKHFAKSISKGKTKQLPPEAEELLQRHNWPGNVRELRNAVHRTLALGVVGIGLQSSQNQESAPRSSAPQIFQAPADKTQALSKFHPARKQILHQFEQEYLAQLWDRFRGNLSAAARAAGIDRKYLRELLTKHGLYP